MMLRKVLVGSLLLVFGCLCAAQQVEIRKVPIKDVDRTSGQKMYVAYCAACHGIDGKGTGPAAEALKVAPPDLTTLAKGNGGKYPSAHVTSVIQGDVGLPAHGSKEMPVWGSELFWQMSQGHSSEVQLRVSNLNKHIEALQAK